MAPPDDGTGRGWAAPLTSLLMEVVVGPERAVPPPSGSAVTIGAYDGVHLGHQHLLAELRRRAAAAELQTVVVTFDRHPATVVRPESAPLLLTDLDQKLELLAACGVDRTLIVPFDHRRADQSAEEFVDEVLVEATRAQLVMVGADFHFGHGRKGDVALLGDIGARVGFVVKGIVLHADESDEVVSSTRIRRLVAAGDVAEARRLLGRPHQVRGVVGHGDGRGGAELGYPTANVELPDGLALPAEGIYACWYRRPDGTVHPAAVSLGRRPTFHHHSDRPVLEAHLLDFDGDLYGERAEVGFVTRLRDEVRFDQVSQLVAQMARDVEATRRVLAAEPG